MRRTSLGAALGAALLIPALAFGALAAGCQTEAELRTMLRQAPVEVSFRVLQGELAAYFVERYNAIPPRTDVVADRVVIARSPAGPDDLLVFFVADCRVDAATFSGRAVDQILDEAPGFAG